MAGSGNRDWGLQEARRLRVQPAGLAGWLITLLPIIVTVALVYALAT